MDIPTRVQILRDTVRQALVFMMDKQPLDSNRVQWSNTVSYTHLTLPTIRLV